MNVASAVGAIIPDEQGRILLLRRAKDPRKGKLGAPGGFMDPGETVEVALRREVMEEVNLDVVSMEYLYSAPNYYEYRGITYPTADLFFVGHVKSFETLRAMDEVESVLFADPREIDEKEIAFPSLYQAIRVYLDRPADSRGRGGSRTL
jgi:ADP-ribose pyrophosphatase YjhB (NUDIX family)